MSMFVFITGLVLTMLGVGGIEGSITDEALLSGVLISTVGLSIMWAGTLMMAQEDYA